VKQAVMQDSVTQSRCSKNLVWCFTVIRLHRPYYVRRCSLLLLTEYHGRSVGLSVTLVSPCKKWLNQLMWI